MARAAEVIARLSMSIYEPLHVFRRATHRTRSHSLASTISRDRPVVSAAMITILPVLSISTRAICTPAAVTALTALVTSCCRNVEGARGIVSHPLPDAVAPHLHLQPHSDTMQGDAADAIST